MYWNMIILNPSRFKVEPHSKYWYFCIELVDLLSLPFSESARAISHLMAVPKNRGKCKSATISLHRGDSLSASGPPEVSYMYTMTDESGYQTTITTCPAVLIITNNPSSHPHPTTHNDTPTHRPTQGLWFVSIEAVTSAWNFLTHC